MSTGRAYRWWTRLPEFTEADATRRIEEILARGDPARAKRLLARWRELFLPSPPPTVAHNIALCDPQSGWTRAKREITPTLLLGHLEGLYALGGIYAGTARVICIDLDNQAGKHAGGRPRAVRLDSDLAARRRLVELAVPEGVWVRSSHSHGLHCWVLLEDPVPLERLPPIICDRLKAAVPRVAGLSRAGDFLAAPPGGLDGWLEIHPYQNPGGQGRVVRAPAGPGSAVFTRDGRVLDRPGPAIDYLLDNLKPARLTDLAPGRINTQLALPALPRKHTFASPAPTPPPPDRERRGFSAQLRACDGRLPEHLRADLPTQARIANRVRREGCPVGMRHASTFTLAYVAKRHGVPQRQAIDDAISWILGPAYPRSREAQRNHVATVRKTESVVRYVYDYAKRAPGGGSSKRRRRAPVRMKRPDLLRLQQLLAHDGYTVKLALHVLGYAHSNGYYDHATRRLLCELPVEAIGVRTRRAREAFQRLQDVGLLALRRRAVPRWRKGRVGDPAAEQEARARLFDVSWDYAGQGHVLPRQPNKPVRETQLSRAQRAIPDFAPARRVCRSGERVEGGEACGRCGPVPPEANFEAGPSGCGNREAISKGLVDASPQARQPRRRPWATRGPWERAAAREVPGEGGSGGEGVEAAKADRRPAKARRMSAGFRRARSAPGDDEH